MADSVLTEVREKRIFIVTINRPERRNALNLEARVKLNEAWRRFKNEDDLWVMIMTGAGDKAFCAGADLKESAERHERGDLFRPPEDIKYLCDYQIWKPMIAAINGVALAAGFHLAMDCDIRLAADHAEMAVSEVKWNLSAGWASELTRQMHLQHALEVVCWGDRGITAQRAFEMGWVSRVTPPDKLMDEAMAWAERTLYLAPRAVRHMKEVLYQGAYLPPSVGHAYAAALESDLRGMDDTKEGLRAFQEKRKPNFQNK